MALSRPARELAAEIKHHDWSDAPFRADRAGHRREHDRPERRSPQQLNDHETACLRMNVMWVAAQVLAHADPNFDVYEFAEACGVPTRNARGELLRSIEAGLHRDPDSGFHQPGTWSTVSLPA